MGNEPRLFTELYQPTRWDRKRFIAPYLDLYKTPLSVFQGGDNRLARYDIRRIRAGADLGTTFGTAAEARLGGYRERGSPRVAISESQLVSVRA